MDLRKQLRESLQNEGIQKRGGVWHSKAYHRFFEGYEEFYVQKADGKGLKIERIYTSDYYRQDLTKNKRLILRLVFFTDFILACSLFISSAISPIAINTTWYLVIPQVVSIPFLFWILLSFVSYIPAPQLMTIFEYKRSSGALRKAIIGAAICLAVTAIATSIFALVNRSGETSMILICAAKYFGAAGLIWFMNWLENRVKYSRVPNTNKIPNQYVEKKSI